MRVRRHVESSGGGERSAAARTLGVLLVLGITFGVGYGLSAWWISPGPLFQKEHSVPRLFELSSDEARARLGELGFRVRLAGDQFHPSIARGRVVWQDPPPGVVLRPNATVQLVVSAGPPPAVVPDVAGFSVEHAIRVISASGLKVGRLDSVPGRDPGVVLGVRPAIGSGRPIGSSVDLVVSAPVPAPTTAELGGSAASPLTSGEAP